MKLEELMAVSGLPGLYKVASNRPNGLIIENLDDGKRRFASVRKHQFSPLETIAVFTLNDSVPLTEVLQKMYVAQHDHPPPAHNSDNSTLRTYFQHILPDHDPTRVYPKDIKKMIKWYNFLDERNLLAQVNDEEE